MSMSFIRIELFVNSRYSEFVIPNEREVGFATWFVFPSPIANQFMKIEKAILDLKSNTPYFQITNLKERLYLKNSDHLASILHT